jgi:fructosamine-3-kinase
MRAKFFQCYHALRLIPSDFWEKRGDLYNLYPLLVHVGFLGGGYVGSVEQTLRQFGIQTKNRAKFSIV